MFFAFSIKLFSEKNLWLSEILQSFLKESSSNPESILERKKKNPDSLRISLGEILRKHIWKPIASTTFHNVSINKMLD